MRFVIGIIMIAVAVLLIWKTEWMIRSFGRIAWAEDKLGSGGTWTFWKILGIIIIFLSFIIMSGAWIRILDAIFT